MEKQESSSSHEYTNIQPSEKSSSKSCKFIESKITHRGRYLSALEKKYEVTDEKGRKRFISWETVDYNNRMNEDSLKENKTNVPYELSIIPILNKTKEIIIISNFRFIVDKFCLEFPSGSIRKEDGDNFLKSTKNACERVLYQETGYKGKFKKYLADQNLSEIEQLEVCSNIFYDPWKSKDNFIQCICDVDENIEPEFQVQDEEIIDVFKVKIKDLIQFITVKVQNENYAISAELYMFACGMFWSEKLKSVNLNFDN